MTMQHDDWDLDKEILPFFQNEADQGDTEYDSAEEYQQSAEYVEKQQRFKSMLNLFYNNYDPATSMLAFDCIKTYITHVPQRDIRTDTLAYFLCRPHLDRHPFFFSNEEDEPLQPYEIEFLSRVDKTYGIYDKHTAAIRIESMYNHEPESFSVTRYDQDVVDIMRIDYIARTANDLQYCQEEENLDLDEVKDFLTHSIGFSTGLGPSQKAGLNKCIQEHQDNLIDLFGRAMAQQKAASGNLKPQP